MKKISAEITKEQLIADFRVVVADAEALLKATANQGGDKLMEIRARAEESVRVAKDRMSDTQAELLAKAREAAQAGDEYVHQNPWRAISVAATACLVLGMIIGRR